MLDSKHPFIVVLRTSLNSKTNKQKKSSTLLRTGAKPVDKRNPLFGKKTNLFLHKLLKVIRYGCAPKQNDLKYDT